MRVVVSVLATVLGLAAVSPSAAQGPPPPARLPDHLREPVNGYSMQTPFQKWRMRVEREKGEALRQALAEPPVIPGERQIGRTFLTFAWSWDMGVVKRGELRTFCPTRADWTFEAVDCHYIYREVAIPAQAAVFGEAANPVSRWMESNFDAERVASALAAGGVPPDGDLWRAGDDLMFADHPSAVPMLLENVVKVVVDSRSCPTLAEAVRALDRGRIGWRTDVLAVGDDQRSRPPGPHSITGTYTLELYTGRGFMTLSGDDEALWEVVSPALKAAEACATG